MRGTQIVVGVTTLVGTPATKARIFSTVMANIRSTASTLLNATCGVKMTLGWDSKRWLRKSLSICLMPSGGRFPASSLEAAL